MTDTQWLLDLVEKATPGPWPTKPFEQIAHLQAGDAHLIALAPELARLCMEQHQALALLARGDAVPPELLLDQVKLVHARSLARFAELNP